MTKDLDIENHKKIEDIISRKGRVKILLYLHKNKTAKYKTLRELIDSEATLVRSLKALSNSNLIERQVLNEKYRPTVYLLTEKGIEVTKAIIKLEEKL